MGERENLVKVFQGFKIRGLSVKEPEKHPHSESVYKEVIAYLKERLGCEYKVNLDLLDNLNYVYRSSNRVVFKFALIYYYFLFLLDDHLDDNPGEFKKWVEIFKMSQLGIEFHGEDQLEKLWEATLDMRKALVPNERYWAKNFNSLIQWVELYPQMERYKNGLESISDENFLEVRVTDGIIDTQLFLYELDSELDVTEQLSKNSDFITMNKNLCYNILIVNDLCSLLKEVSDGQAKFNHVYIRMKSKNLTVEEATDSLVAQVKETERLIGECGANLKKLSSVNLNKYVDQVVDYCNSNLYWSVTCARYNNSGYKFFDILP